MRLQFDVMSQPAAKGRYPRQQAQVIIVPRTPTRKETYDWEF
jgi:hypothetical protein